MDWTKEMIRASGVERASDANSYAKLEWVGPKPKSGSEKFYLFIIRYRFIKLKIQNHDRQGSQENQIKHTKNKIKKPKKDQITF
jgi:hypothetical protein